VQVASVQVLQEQEAWWRASYGVGYRLQNWMGRLASDEMGYGYSMLLLQFSLTECMYLCTSRSI